MGRLRGFFSLLLGALFPRACVMCSAEGEILCSICARQVHIPAWHVQRIQEGTPLFSRISYKEKAVQRMLHAWKYRGDASAGVWWSTWISEEGGAPQEFAGAVFVPVPLAREAYAERGFNQAEVLAVALAKKYNGTVAHLLGRVPRKAQAKTKKEDRATARAQSPFYEEKVLTQARAQGGVPWAVILVDDVVTTGSTLMACADKLKAAGVQNVCAATLAYGNDA